ncbi:UNKNOWN [Stylonychia lemnae]|uniref:Uncharacterized protein n=1 Tax=Stylonychia lemnae TaxID=5949 RepID=A0A078AMH2_STYLE|nr:UNKNOWN [Stylonychia lemnae]|eukprot:CDW83116.1 UNKNOWN [Stylonychia lemnae]
MSNYQFTLNEEQKDEQPPTQSSLNHQRYSSQRLRQDPNPLIGQDPTVIKSGSIHRDSYDSNDYSYQNNTLGLPEDSKRQSMSNNSNHIQVFQYSKQNSQNRQQQQFQNQEYEQQMNNLELYNTDEAKEDLIKNLEDEMIEKQADLRELIIKIKSSDLYREQNSLIKVNFQNLQQQILVCTLNYWTYRRIPQLMPRLDKSSIIRQSIIISKNKNIFSVLMMSYQEQIDLLKHQIDNSSFKNFPVQSNKVDENYYTDQIKEFKLMIQKQQELINEMTKQMEQKHQDYELLKQQLLMKDTLQLAQEQMQNQKQYFESIAYQNNHLQLELQKISEQFRNYVQSSQKENIQSARQQQVEKQRIDEQFYVDHQKLQDDYSEIIKTTRCLPQDFQKVINKIMSLKDNLISKDYGLLLMNLMKINGEVLKIIDRQSQLYQKDSQLDIQQKQCHSDTFANSYGCDSDSSLKYEIMRQNNLDKQYQNYIQTITDQSPHFANTKTQAPQELQEPNQNKKLIKSSSKVTFQKFEKPAIQTQSKSKDKYKSTQQERLSKMSDSVRQFDIKREIDNLKSQSPKNSQIIISPTKSSLVQRSPSRSHSKSKKKNLQYQQIVQNQFGLFSTRQVKRNLQQKSPDLVFFEYNESDPIVLSNQSAKKQENSTQRKKSIGKVHYNYNQTSFNQIGQTHSPMKSNRNQRQTQDPKFSPDRLLQNTSPNKMYKLGIENVVNRDYKPLQRNDSTLRKIITQSNSQANLQSDQRLRKNSSISNVHGSQGKNVNSSVASNDAYNDVISPRSFVSQPQQFTFNSKNYASQSILKKSSETNYQSQTNTQMRNQIADKLKQRYLEKENHKMRKN